MSEPDGSIEYIRGYYTRPVSVIAAKVTAGNAVKLAERYGGVPTVIPPGEHHDQDGAGEVNGELVGGIDFFQDGPQHANLGDLVAVIGDNVVVLTEMDFRRFAGPLSQIIGDVEEIMKSKIEESKV